MPWKLKLDEAGHVVVQDGKAVYITDKGEEIAHDAEYTAGTITRLNGESKTHREAKEAAEAKLAKFEGIEDPEAAIKALETVANLDQSKLLAADKVDEIKRGVEQAVEAKFTNIVKAKDEQITALTTERDGLNTELDDEKIGGGFARSKYLADETILTPDIAQAYFGKHFKRENGKLVAYDANGLVIYSREKPDQPAEIDEALKVLVEAYPRKDNILKGVNRDGVGVKDGQQVNGSKTITRSQFESLGAGERRAKMSEGFKVVEG